MEFDTLRYWLVIYFGHVECDSKNKVVLLIHVMKVILATLCSPRRCILLYIYCLMQKKPCIAHRRKREEKGESQRTFNTKFFAVPLYLRS